jgi:hypothetical protein
MLHIGPVIFGEMEAVVLGRPVAEAFVPAAPVFSTHPLAPGRTAW